MGTVYVSTTIFLDFHALIVMIHQIPYNISLLSVEDNALRRHEDPILLIVGDVVPFKITVQLEELLL